MKKMILALLTIGCIGSFACKSSKAPVETAISENNKMADTNSFPLTNTYWRLTELMGTSIGPTPADKKEIHIRLKDNGDLEGFAGCNGIGGKYEVKPGDRIAITNVIGTMIACPDLETENKLLELLKTADNYNLNGNRLVLNRARMAPLARFEARKIPN